MLLNTSENLKRNLAKILILLMVFSSSLLSAQEKITLEEYNRAVGFMYENYHNKKAFNLNIRPNWFPDSTGVWFVNHSAEAKRYTKITFPNLQTSDLFDHAKLAKILSDSLCTAIEAKDIPIRKLEYKSPTELVVSIKNKSHILNTTI